MQVTRQSICFVVASILVPGLLASFAAKSAAADRPNILFLFADDQNTKTLSCYPEAWPWVKTPNIDRIASQGIRFQHCYLGSWCMPSRANLLTGRYPHAIESMRMQGQ